MSEAQQTRPTTAASSVGTGAAKQVVLTDPQSFLGAELIRRFGASQGWSLVERGTTPETLLERCLASDVIVLDVQRGGCEEAKSLLQSLQQVDLTTRPKTLIVVSTVMTWADTKKPDGAADATAGPASQEADAEAAPAEATTGGEEGEEDLPLAEEDYRKRRPHPSYKKQLYIEKYALTMRKKKEGLRPYVVCAGLQYGRGEDVLHWLFRAAWQGDPQELPVIGEGKNAVPTVHVADLASAVLRIAAAPPEDDHYVLAVDNAISTLHDIVQAISTKLGTGKIRSMQPEEALLVKGLSQRELDLLQVDLRMESLVMRDLLSGNMPTGSESESAAAASSSMGGDWVAESGFVENIGAVVQQYRVNRSLTPIRIAVLGPPMAGKTELCKLVADHYGVHHLATRAVIDEVLATDKELAEEIAAQKDSNAGRISDEHLAMVFARKLTGWQCKNQGYVLDGFPKNAVQAALLFAAAAATGSGQQSAAASRAASASVGENPRAVHDGDVNDEDGPALPGFVFVLEASDDQLRKRVMAMPQALADGTHNTEEGFSRRVKRWRAENTSHEGAAQWLESHGVLPMPLDTEAASPQVLLGLVCREVGAPHQYGPSEEELAERHLAAERAAKEAADREHADRAAAETREREARAAAVQQWERRLTELRAQEADVLRARSEPFRTYLMSTVMPTLSRGLVELAEVRPDDPVDYLATFLLKASLQ